MTVVFALACALATPADARPARKPRPATLPVHVEGVGLFWIPAPRVSRGR